MQSMPGGDQVGDRLLAEAVRGDPGAELVRPRDRGGGDVGRPARGEVAGVAVDPVADELDPPVAASGLRLDLGDQVVGLDLRAVVADVALAARDVPAGPDDPRQVVAVVHPVRVDGHARVAQQQRPGVAVGDRLRLRGRLVDTAVLVQPDVAVRVDQAGHQPAVGRDGLRAGHLVVAQQAAVVDPQVALFAVRQHDAAQVQRRHGSTLSSHARHPATRALGDPHRIRARTHDPHGSVHVRRITVRMIDGDGQLPPGPR